jgi:hypothetical protein
MLAGASWAVDEAISMLGDVEMLAGDTVRASWAVDEAIPTPLSPCDACCVPPRLRPRPRPRLPS